MSGRLDLSHAAFCLGSSLLVTLVASHMLFPERVEKGLIRRSVRFATYVMWLLREVVLANIHLIRLALHPRMRRAIDPHMVKMKVGLEKDVSITALSNSITLTPGTITVLYEDGWILVHAIDERAAQGIASMAKRIRRVFENG